MSDVLWAVGFVVVCGGLFSLAYGIEPHWVAKDGRRFITTSQTIDRHGSAVGRRREVRGALMSDGTVLLSKRRLLRTKTAMFRVRATLPTASRGRRQYVLEQVPVDPMGDQLILRIPRTSRLTAVLDGLAPPASAEEA